jgi:S1/P1 Nuclease
MRKFLAVLCLCVLAHSQLFAWGPKGHAVVADIAEARLTPVARKNLRLLLGNNSLASISTWPDAIRDLQPETYGWHFVDIPGKAAGFDEQRDCYRPQDKGPTAQTDHHNCVVDRIEIFRQKLADGNASELDRLIALMFVVHFVGDIHQPLHAIEDARGGNDVKVRLFGVDQCGNRPCNFHGAWDTALIEHAGLSEADYVRHLDTLIAANHWDQRPAGAPQEWANESHRAALRVWLADGANLDEAYYRANIGLVDERLAMAGLRLAALLNDTLGKIPTQQFEQELRRHPRY